MVPYSFLADLYGLRTGSSGMPLFVYAFLPSHCTSAHFCQGSLEHHLLAYGDGQHLGMVDLTMSMIASVRALSLV